MAQRLMFSLYISAICKYGEQTHNLKVIGSNPIPATKYQGLSHRLSPFLLPEPLINRRVGNMSLDEVERIVI
jgi:hypothetical protein